MKLYKTNEKYGAKYQTEPKCNSGIGRFQVYLTDNTNARQIGKQPKWTVRDLYTMKQEKIDTLTEVVEWCRLQESR